MYKVSGSNIHGQWICASKNETLTDFPALENSAILNIDEAKITAINWAYNVFVIQNDFYVIGAWAGIESTIVKIKLPEKTSQQENHLTLVGNDRRLFLTNVKSYDLWILNLPEDEESAGKWDWSYKKLDLISQTEEKSYIKKIVASHSDSLCILTSSGDVYEYPVKIETSHCIGKICDLEYGNEHTILLTDAGRVYTWGNGKRCQLGHGDLTSLMEPTEVEALAGIKIIKISSGGWHSLALSSSGDLYVWGWNDSGQLGIQEKLDDDLKSRTVKVLLKKGNSCALPTLVDFYDDDGSLVDDVMVTDIACGSRHSVIILADNTVWTTGLNRWRENQRKYAAKINGMGEIPWKVTVQKELYFGRKRYDLQFPLLPSTRNGL